jgi:uncharacterized protein (TIGR03435 family)
MKYTTLAFFLAVSALAQNPPAPAFDVATIKLNPDYRQNDGRTWAGHIRATPSTLSMTNVPLETLITWAYHVPRTQLSGPAWLDGDRFDVQAKAPGPAKEDEMRPMMQALLAERFHLEAHRETRTMSVYAIVEAKTGHKMRPSQLTEVQEGKEDPKSGHVVRGAAIPEIAFELSDARDIKALVVDASGLKGRFDFEINIAKYVPPMKPGDPPPDIVSILQEAFQQELGLKLESRKMPMEVLVIDRIDKTPAEN